MSQTMPAQLYIVAKEKVIPVPVKGMRAIGGAKGSDLKIPELKQADDYLIVSPADGAVEIHLLKSRVKGKKVRLEPGQTFELLDMRLLMVPLQIAAGPSANIAHDILQKTSEFMSCLRGGDRIQESMQDLLHFMLEQFSLDRGLIVTQNPDGKYEICAQRGKNIGSDWLSERLIKESMETQKPVSVHNVLGSDYSHSKSLMASGFLSVFAWPLVFQGKSIGALVLGSKKPHSGLSAVLKQVATILVHLSSALVFFYVRNERQKLEIESIRNRAKESPILTNNGRFLETCETARQIADTNLATYIHGETGVGKEVMARWIHSLSPRGKMSFVAINCGAIPENLLESVLFGHKKGAFTGAISDQKGKFELASGGTIFLDEISDLPENLQVKLLRVLQEQQIEPLGARQVTKIDCRVLSASHKNLWSLVEAGNFREDLYYRLAEMQIYIPPLRERPEDIPLLGRTFLEEIQSAKDISPAAWDWLKAQEWRGNIRELRSSIRRSAALCRTAEIEISDFERGKPQASASSERLENAWLGGENLEAAKQRFVEEKVRLAVSRAGGNRTQAAKLLGVTPRTLFRYLEEMNQRETMTDLSGSMDAPVTPSKGKKKKNVMISSETQA